MNTIRICLFISLLAVFSFPFQKNGDHACAQANLLAKITSLKSDTDITHASWSICVLDVKRDSVIAEYNSHLSLIPASTHKILTTAAALSLLGWDFKYETRLEYDGKLDSIAGILHGNIYIKGSGDPTLNSETFKKKSDTVPLTDQWAKIILAKGIKKIKGAVVADAGAFDDETIPSTWVWGDMGNYYGAGACGLNFSDNKFSLYYKSGSKKGDTAFITKISPPIPGMKVASYVRTGGYLDNAFIYGAPYDELRSVKGSIPANKINYEVEGSIPDPPLFCAQSLDSSLRKIGIIIGEQATSIRSQSERAPSEKLEVRTQKSEARQTIYIHYSHTLDKIIYQTNIQSNNLFAESILKTIACVSPSLRGNKTNLGSEQTGIDIVQHYWRSKGVGLKGSYMADGCGLSRFNAINTKQLSEILRTVTLDSVVFNTFYNSLPVAGKSGSLGKLCKGTLAENNIHAKSGYMTRVRSYAGYATSKSGKLLSFAIIINNYDCSPAQMKDKLEELMIAIAEIE
ncbi:MAG: D-alanyl-D-alanine carboxypeptidase/D-alanyl-D-alanine-endopeptidase [Bacteroidetes bacterium]|nr:D-alanyl-D-alanine carboxypeptidase/D-alanyl-D-alanine-endopeptidase [Bacteroidota bacterium]